MFPGAVLSRLMVEYLTTPLPGYRCRRPWKAGELRALLRPGDVLLVEGQARVSQIIGYLTRSRWTHAALYVGDALLRWGGPEAAAALDRHGASAASLLVESDLKEGVIAVPIEKYLEHNLRICRPAGLGPGELERVLAVALEHLGVRYDRRNILDLARYLLPFQFLPRFLRRPALYLGSSTSREVICSALIAKAFYKVDLCIEAPLAGGGPGPRSVRHPSYITPCDYDLSENFEVVKARPQFPAARALPRPSGRPV